MVTLQGESSSLPDRFSGQPSDWEEWSWNFQAYLAICSSTSVSTLERIEEHPTREITDDDLAVMLDALDVDHQSTFLQETSLAFSPTCERVCTFGGSPERGQQRP